MAEVSQTREDAVPSLSYDKQVFVITSGLTLTFNHGYADHPRNVWLVLKCLTAELGYAVGDEVYLSPFTYTTGTTAASVATSLVQVKLRMVALPVVVNFTSGAPTAITAANWNLEVRLQR
jgi:hypothetical protein